MQELLSLFYKGIKITCCKTEYQFRNILTHFLIYRKTKLKYQIISNIYVVHRSALKIYNYYHNLLTVMKCYTKVVTNFIMKIEYNFMGVKMNMIRTGVRRYGRCVPGGHRRHQIIFIYILSLLST